MLDLLLHRARVITVDDHRPTAKTVGVIGERIVGLDEEVAHMSATTVVDCDGAVVVPGFGDAHNHMAWFGQSLDELDLTGLSSLDDLYERVEAHALNLPEDGFVVGSGYDDNLLGGHPQRTSLDHVTNGRPVWLRHRSGHMCVVSTEVLKRCGLLQQRNPNVTGGFILTGPDGSPTGLLQERAQELVAELVQPYAISELAEAISRASAVYASEGLTHVVEAGIGAGLLGRSPAEGAAYQIAREKGLLRTRVELMVASDNLHELSAHVEDGITVGIDLGLKSGFGDDWLRLGPMKIWLDGSMLGRTAAVSEPLCGHGHGIYQQDPQEMRRLIVDAHRAGWRVAAHAIGDDAVQLALDAFREAHDRFPRVDPRHRIEHAGVVRPDQLAQFAKLAIIPVPQPRFLHTIGDSMARLLGPERLSWMYRHRSFLELGLRVPGSSDRPVAPGPPLLGIQSMVERLSSGGLLLGENERVNATVALRAYTIDAAWASFDERSRGSITRGKYADFAILSDDPTSVNSDRIGAIEVLATFVSGECTFDRGTLSIQRQKVLDSASAARWS